jgi:FHS family L-fucose permease-like MFS transporter
MMPMFFAFGFCNVLVDTLVPKFKAMFSLSYSEVMLTQFCYFAAYFIVSAPAGWLIGRIGYLPSMVSGLLLMALGAFGFLPAAMVGIYPGFLAALFVLAAGVTIVEVAANPAAAVAGPASQASSRLSLAQAFNSAATMVAPLFGAYFILGSVEAPPVGLSTAALAGFRRTQAHVFVAPFAGVASVLVALAALCWLVRALSPLVAPRSAGSWRILLGEKYLMLGALGVFCYVGAEVSIGSSLTNYLMGTDVLGLAAAQAGRLVSLYWGGAMLGRFVGFLILRRFPAGLVLALCAAVAFSLVLFSGLSGGIVAATAILAVGLFNSVMFPAIFALAIEGLGDRTPQASGLICLAIVGGAVVPLAMGSVADRLGLSWALIVPAVCYVWVSLFGLISCNRAIASA